MVESALILIMSSGGPTAISSYTSPNAASLFITGSNVREREAETFRAEFLYV